MGPGAILFRGALSTSTKVHLILYIKKARDVFSIPLICDFEPFQTSGLGAVVPIAPSLPLVFIRPREQKTNKYVENKLHDIKKYICFKFTFKSLNY